MHDNPELDLKMPLEGDSSNHNYLDNEKKEYKTPVSKKNITKLVQEDDNETTVVIR